MTEQNQSDDEIDLPGEDEVFDALGMEVMTLARLRAMALPEVQLASIRIVAEDLEPLVRFYEALTGAAARWLTDDFVDRRIRRWAGTIAANPATTDAPLPTETAKHVPRGYQDL